MMKSNTINIGEPKTKLAFPMRNLFYRRPKTASEPREMLIKMCKDHPKIVPLAVKRALSNPQTSTGQLEEAKALFETMIETARWVKVE